MTPDLPEALVQGRERAYLGWFFDAFCWQPSAIASADEAHLIEEIPAMRAAVQSLTEGDESPAAVAAAVEFVLEGLHLSKRLNKDTSATGATYRSRS